MGTTVPIQTARKVVLLLPININLFRDKGGQNWILRMENLELAPCEYPLRILNSEFINLLSQFVCWLTREQSESDIQWRPNDYHMLKRSTDCNPLGKATNTKNGQRSCYTIQGNSVWNEQ